MGMTIEEAMHHLNTWSTTHGSGQTTDKQHEEAKKIAMETMRKYQMFRAKYVERLKADMVAMLIFLWNDIEDFDAPICDYASSDCISKWQVHELIQQRINEIKGEVVEKKMNLIDVNNIDCTKLPKKLYPYMKDILDFLDVQPTIDAIPKDQYEARLKADELDMLAEIKNYIEVLRTRPDILGNDKAQEIILDCLMPIDEKEKELRGTK